MEARVPTTASGGGVPMNVETVTLPIGGYEIRFPCNPYDSQKVLMDRVLQALKQSQVGIGRSV